MESVDIGQHEALGATAIPIKFSSTVEPMTPPSTYCCLPALCGYPSGSNSRKVKFTNSTALDIMVFACPPEGANPETLVELEQALKAKVASIDDLGVARVIELLQKAFPRFFLVYLKVPSDDSVLTRIANGAEGYQYWWWVQQSSAWHFAGRGAVSSDHVVQFTNTG